MAVPASDPLTRNGAAGYTSPAMTARDFSILVLVCALWALNTVVSKIAVADWGIPPLFFAACRFALVAALVWPWLRPMPRPRWRLLAIALLMGGGTFALVSVGLKTASPSSAAIVIQLGVPAATLLSIVVLGERVSRLRGLGILLSLAGVLIVMYDPHGLAVSTGLLFIAASAVAGAAAAILMKQMGGARPLQFQAWIGLVSALVLPPLSFAFEEGQFASVAALGWRFFAVVAFTAILVSIVAHTLYYGLIQRYDATVVAPLTLLNPLLTIAFGIGFTGDRVDLKMAVGTIVALAGVLIIAVRRNHVQPLLLLIRNRF